MHSPACRSVGKRGIDIVVAAALLVVTSPILLAAALVIGRPVFFSQERTGWNGRRFRLIKLRTMNDARDADGQLLPDTQRLTRFGRVLRKTSLDELPGLINVFRGDMSLVGPRPLLPRYDAFYSTREAVRFTVRPGITGLAQVSGRNAVAWDDRLALDVRYVNEWSHWLDAKILARTALKVLAGSGVVIDPAAVMLDLDVERMQRTQ
jgi:sugar transferase EpsL